MRRGAKLLDARCPIEWSHPLNRGLEANWAVPPLSGWRGALVLRDLVRGGKAPNDGTFSGAVTWAGHSHTGGNGSLQFGGASTDHIQLWTSSVLPIAGKAASAAVWFKPTGSLTSFQTILDWGSGSSNRMFSLFLGGNPNQLWVAIANTTGTDINLTQSWLANTWQHLAVTCDGSNVAVYRNGQNIGSGNVGTGNIGPGMTFAPFQWGGNPSGGGQPFQGYQDDLIVYNRALSSADVAALYDQARRGNPDRWRWLRRVTYFVGSSSPPTTTLFRRTMSRRTGSRSPALSGRGM